MKGIIIKKDLQILYPKSPSCSCEICSSYCQRPGWWTVKGAKDAIKCGFGKRMMLEISEDFSFGVLSPAFKGCESDFALQEFAKNGCTFHNHNHCDLHKTPFLPLECAFCHHSRQGLGPKCHQDIGLDWNSVEGRSLIEFWGQQVGLWKKYNLDKKIRR